MDAITLWQRYQDWLYYHEEIGLYLDISRIRFDQAFLEAMKPKFDGAFRDMEALEGGAIANPDEQRMVGHYWLRNPELAPTPQIKQQIIDTVNKIETFVAKVHKGEIKPPQAEKFTDLLSIGIGGSALGPQFVADALAPDYPLINIHFIDNSDPDGIDRILQRLGDRLKSTLILVISKSGGTPEPRNGMMEVKQALLKQNLHFPDQAIATTQIGSKLYQEATSQGWLETFPMEDWIGGRTSEMSAVGLLPAALQGIDIHALLQGAQTMDIATRQPDIKTNPAALLALCWYAVGGGRGQKDMVILPYKDRLILLSRYLQQLVMESLGKEKDLDGNIVNQGISVYGNKGSTDQHAYVQQLRDGVPNFFATFIEVLRDRQGLSSEIEPGVTAGDYLSGFLQGTREALYDNQRDSITVTITEVNPYTVGALVALYERAVSLYASLVNINAYHQPGVEAGKKAAAQVLELQHQSLQALRSHSQGISISDLATKIDAQEQVETLYKILRHLAANDRGVELSGDPSKPGQLIAKWR
ncbi:glucose-6-phosphate isomerase [Limnospira fusiformis KN01]|uniref:glucose-6-phosphate isomerase n=1 Tax=Limnospira TaxID=2596745 RepID=UPI001658C0CE|nr:MULTISPECIES: glucose-6-phosphate isomerase [Limnospira]MDT9199394.1 glucose-6-phosphate isomerase [Limnospira sp. PMC 1042.18]ULB44850.1 glucose-6-phosphate isomerase [Limnospira fusiformis KN01]